MPSLYNTLRMYALSNVWGKNCLYLYSTSTNTLRHQLKIIDIQISEYSRGRQEWQTAKREDDTNWRKIIVPLLNNVPSASKLFGKIFTRTTHSSYFLLTCDTTIQYHKDWNYNDTDADEQNPSEHFQSVDIRCPSTPNRVKLSIQTISKAL